MSTNNAQPSQPDVAMQPNAGIEAPVSPARDIIELHPQPDFDEMLRALRILHKPGTVIEVRGLGVAKYRDVKATASGYFDAPETLVKALSSRRPDSNGVWTDSGQWYVTLQHIKPDLLSRRCNRIEFVSNDTTTKDQHVTHYQWLPLDFDAKRDTGISSTDAEHTAALNRAHLVRTILQGHGWPDPIAADSGNGAHLLYRINLPADKESVELVRRVIEALAGQFSTDEVDVDGSVFNPARIWKLYGTVARKGDSTPEGPDRPARPHRVARLLCEPDAMEVVTREQLEALVGQLSEPDQEPEPECPQYRQRGQQAGTPFDIDSFIATHGLDVGSPAEVDARIGGKARRWIFSTCPFNPDHQKSATLWQFANGAVQFRCLHQSCGEHKWHDFRSLYDKDYAEWVASGKTPPQACRPAQDGPTPPAAADGLPLGRRLVDITEQSVDWLWPERIPLGMISMLDGDPGVGKSMVMGTIAARVTCGGTFPDHSKVGEPDNVILISLEDDEARTIRPRLRAAGADLTRVISLPTVPYRTSDGTVHERPFSLPTDFPTLRKAIEQHHARLVVIDPIMGALDSTVDAHKDQDVRSKVASPLKQLAEETGCAIVLVRHLSKTGGDRNAIYRGGGSIAWIGAARAGMMAIRDPNDAERCVLATAKCNLAKMPASWSYRVTATEGGIGQIAWIGEDKRAAADLIRAEHAKERARGTIGDTAQAALAYVTGRSPAPVTIAEVAQATGLDDDAARQCLHRLATAGRIQRLGRGQFYLPETPEQREKAQEHKAMCARMHINDPFVTEVPETSRVTSVTKDLNVNINGTPPTGESRVAASQTPSQQGECDNVTCDSCDNIVTDSPAAAAEDHHQHRVYVDDHGLWHCGCGGHWATEDLPVGSQRLKKGEGVVLTWDGHVWERPAQTYFATCAKCGGPLENGSTLYCDDCRHRHN